MIKSDHFRRTYWEHILPKDGHYVYFAGDGARWDRDGYHWVIGRVDNVISVAGHRLATMEIESALVSHPAEAAVDDLTEVALVHSFSGVNISGVKVIC